MYNTEQSTLPTADMYNSTIFPDLTTKDQSLNGLRDAMYSYVLVHGPLALMVCIVGVAVNIINIVVLSHKEMISPVNRLLQAIAFADLLTMMTYIPYSLLFYIIHGVEGGSQRNSYSAISFLKYHGMSSMIFHTASIWLTVTVALFRYIFLSVANGRKLCSITHAYIAIAVVFALSVFINLPQAFLLKINRWNSTESGDSWYYLDTNGLPKEYNTGAIIAQNVMTAILVKIGPSLFLIILSILLIRFLLRAQSKYRQMRQSCTSREGSVHMMPNDKRRQEQTNQTTKLLVAVAIVFTLVELPGGVFFGLSSLGGNYEEMFWLLGNLFDLVTMISCAVNFVLYCIMSSQFRKIFMKMLRIKNLKSFLLCSSICVKSEPSSLNTHTSNPTEHTCVNKPPSSSNSISLDDIAESEKLMAPEKV